MPSECPEKGRRWTICETCWSVFAPDGEEACECDLIGESEKSRRVEVVPASRLEEVETERDHAEAAVVRRFQEKQQAESKLHALRGVLEGEVERLREIQRKAENEAAQAPSEARALYSDGQGQMARTAATRLWSLLDQHRSALDGSAVSGDAAGENLPSEQSELSSSQPPSEERCGTCGGSGEAHPDDIAEDDGEGPMPCPDCNGTGTKPPGGEQ